MNLYDHEDKINTNILKKYQSYLDWIELVYLKNKTNTITIEKCSKDSIVNILEKSNKTEYSSLEEMIKQSKTQNSKKLEEIKNKLQWEYEYLYLSKIESKSSVSKIKQNDNDIKQSQNIMKTPEFLKKENAILTGAQKGTLVHLCLQKLNVKEEYTKEKIEELIESLKFKKIITAVEAYNIDSNTIMNFTKISIWNELKTAKLIEREKPFYITIPAGEIYNNDIKEEILVQGIIDLFYINAKDELVLVDYKTDRVKEEEELILKYNKQLELYKQALESSLDKKVNKVYIYSTYLSKEVRVQ